MVSMSKFNAFVADIHNKVHNLGSDTLKLALTNTAPTSSNTLYHTDIDANELANGNGYTTGGATVGITSSTQSSGTYKLIASAAVVWTASGSMGPFRYIVLYNSTASNGPLIGWYDYGSSLTLTALETFTVTFDGTNGIINCT